MRVANNLHILIRGGGDLSSGVILRLARAGCSLLVLELEKPLAVRRAVSFAQAVYNGAIVIEDIHSSLAKTEEEAWDLIHRGWIPVMVDPSAEAFHWFQPDVIVDGRMMKKSPANTFDKDTFQIGLGPGFVSGKNCHAVIETKRGPFLGRVIWQGGAEEDTGLPEKIGDAQAERVVRAPIEGVFIAKAKIGDHLMSGQVLAQVESEMITAPFECRLRGMLMDGLWVSKGLKVGDLDPRLDPRIWQLVSDKALAVGGGVLEAILSVPILRRKIGR